MQGERDELLKVRKNHIENITWKHTLRISVVLRQLKSVSQGLLCFVGEFHIAGHDEIMWRSMEMASRFIVERDPV